MNDTIYRQAAIDAARKCHVKEMTPAYMLIDKAEVMTELAMLPSAQPMRTKGKWIRISNEPFADTFECSECGQEPPIRDFEWYLSDYCPNCGADMRDENSKKGEI